MKKILLSLLLLAGMATGASAQLLYKISDNGLEKPSYIIGTHHLANKSFVEKIAGVKDALTVTDQVYGELNFDDVAKTDSVKALQQAMYLSDGQTLKSVLTAEQYKKLDNFLKNFMGVGLSHPMVDAQYGKMSPAALTAQFQVLIFLQHHMGDFDPSSTFDQYFHAQAKKNNEPVGGLETISFQAGLLYGQPLKRQIEQLMCLLDHVDAVSDQMDELTNAYYAQDIVRMKKAMDEKMNNACDATEEETAALIDNRNADWAQKMPAIMADKPTFFVVGAGHLAGDKGVLQLLKNAGYTVEAVQ